jgi:hypothetical protein
MADTVKLTRGKLTLFNLRVDSDNNLITSEELVHAALLLPVSHVSCTLHTNTPQVEAFYTEIRTSSLIWNIL